MEGEGGGRRDTRSSTAHHASKRTSACFLWSQSIPDDVEGKSCVVCSCTNVGGGSRSGKEHQRLQDKTSRGSRTEHLTHLSLVSRVPQSAAS
jgi:hypothetical protein